MKYIKCKNCGEYYLTALEDGPGHECFKYAYYTEEVEFFDYDVSIKNGYYIRATSFDMAALKLAQRKNLKDGDVLDVLLKNACGKERRFKITAQINIIYNIEDAD